MHKRVLVLSHITYLFLQDSSPDSVKVEVKDHYDVTIDPEENLIDEVHYNAYQRALLSFQTKASETYTENARPIKFAIAVFFICLYFGYFSYAMFYRYVSLSIFFIPRLS